MKQIQCMAKMHPQPDGPVRPALPTMPLQRVTTDKGDKVWVCRPCLLRIRREKREAYELAQEVYGDET